MSNKTNLNSNKKQELKPLRYPKLKKLHPVFISGLIIIGLLIGWSLKYELTSKNLHDHSFISFNSDQKNVKNDADQKSDYEFQFLNPYILTPVFDKIYHEELASFKDLLADYCANAKKDKSIKQVSVYFRDLTTGAWFGINEKEKFIPASLTKVPVLMAVYQKAENDPAYLQKRLVFKGSYTATYLSAHPEIDDIRTTMKLNESYTIQQLIEFMITKSDNEAAMLLINDVGTENWLALQKRLGNSVPINATSAVNIITVKSYSSFFRILYNSSLLNREYSEKALEVLSRSEYDKGIRQAVPSNIRICHKYGERDTLLTPTKLQIQQLHHAGIVYYPGKPFFICIMTKGGDKHKMENIILDLARITYQQVDKQVKQFKKPNLLKDIE